VLSPTATPPPATAVDAFDQQALERVIQATTDARLAAFVALAASPEPAATASLAAKDDGHGAPEPPQRAQPPTAGKNMADAVGEAAAAQGPGGGGMAALGYLLFFGVAASLAGAWFWVRRV
jgi:hypothetical protein